MNKLLIVLLAVCLISVNAAFVKREADTQNYLADLEKKTADLMKDMQRQISESLNPKQIKKAFNEGVDNVQKLLEPFKQAEAKQ